MDKKIEQPKWDKKKLIFIGGGLLFLVLLLLGASVINRKVYKIDASRITVKEVIRDDFQDAILIDGDIEPINLVLVNTIDLCRKRNPSCKNRKPYYSAKLFRAGNSHF